MSITTLPNDRTRAAQLTNTDLIARLNYWSADLSGRGLVTEAALMREAALEMTGYWNLLIARRCKRKRDIKPRKQRAKKAG